MTDAFTESSRGERMTTNTTADVWAEARRRTATATWPVRAGKVVGSLIAKVIAGAAYATGALIVAHWFGVL